MEDSGEDNGEDIAEDLGDEITKRGSELKQQHSSGPHKLQHSPLTIQGMYGSALLHSPTLTLMCTGRFKRAEVSLPVPDPSLTGTNLGSEPNQTAPNRTCLVCSVDHAMGYCPLKQAGVEICQLCGIAHYGSGPTRICPHMNSVTRCREMLETLKSSPEPRADVELAKKYIVGVIGGLNRKKKTKAQALQPPMGGSNGQPSNPYVSNGDNFMGPSVRGSTRPGKENLAFEPRSSSTAHRKFEKGSPLAANQ